MGWSFRILRVAGIDVKIHYTFLLLLAYYAMLGGGVIEAIISIAFVLLLFLCVLLHEFGHAFAAKAYGIQTPDITLLPFGGLARLARLPDKPMQEFVIAIAGPMVNVVIVAILWVALGFPPLLGGFPEAGSLATLILGQLLWVNKMLIAFNLIPAFPMDGGRVLRALLATQMDQVKATTIAARVGQGIAVIFLLIGLFGLPPYLEPNFILVFIAMFVFMGAAQEAAFAKIRAAIKDLKISDAMLSRFHSLFGDMSIAEAILQASAETQPVFPVTDAHLRLTGMVQRNELLNHEPSDSQAPVSGIARRVSPVESDAPFAKAIQLMQETGQAVLPVVNAGGQVVGLVSLNLLSERMRAARAA